MSQTTPDDAKAYYGYLFEPDKKPTKVLEQLLRALAHHIVNAIGNTDEKSLNPAKLASFYKAVGGNYDSLFVEVPPTSISWIYASIGCQHTLQPTIDDFQPPSIPALTTRGFVRWQSLEILLGPEEHVPFIQNAVRDFGLKNPESGELFPTDLPKEAFPLKADAEIERWHAACAEKLRLEARQGEAAASRPDLPPRPKVQPGVRHVPPRRSAHSHSPTHSPHPRPGTAEYFEATRPPIQFQHVSSQSIPMGRPVRPKLSRSPSHRHSQFLAPEADRMSRARRRSSVPENVSSPSPGASPTIPDLYPPIPPPSYLRRHSQPRAYRAPSVSSLTSDTSDSDVSPSQQARPGHGSLNPRLSQRENDPRYTPAASPVPAAAQPVRPRRGDSRPTSSSDERRKNWPPNVPVDLTGKLSSQFTQGAPRTRETNEANGNPRRRVTRNSDRGTNVRWKDLHDIREFLHRRPQAETEDEDEVINPVSRSRSHSSREERRSSGSEKERRRNRRLMDDRDRDTDREFRERPRMAETSRRSNSHEDGAPRRQNSERRRVPRERYTSPIRGVDGRKYPAAVDGYR
ncbi:hypothetical protein BP5796_03220 [Coleophoma crateriformis]|uniref:DUF7514 domain-containing protein n=1 Tax=Coleophoma crateriformis TaxID=565419 RepID=A0A3D8SML8_9HELO|nr:hypothetical protein BP5796_03220 [Coleophoma crateriformis]